MHVISSEYYIQHKTSLKELTIFLSKKYMHFQNDLNVIYNEEDMKYNYGIEG